MSLQGNGRNHNHRPKLIKDNDEILDDIAIYSGERNDNDSAGHSFVEDVDFAKPVKKDRIDNYDGTVKKNASAYDDLDDYVYRQTKKRHRSRHKRVNLSIPGLSKKHKAKEHHHKHHRSKHRRRKKRWKTWQKVLVSFICILLALIIGLVSTICYLNFKGRQQLVTSDNLALVVPDGVVNTDDGKYITTKDGRQFKYNENITSILCMGIDKESFDTVDGIVGTGGSSDVLFLITIDTATGETNMINISRDTMSDIAVYSTEGEYIKTEKSQICLAYSYGDGKETSCRNQVAAVRQLFYNVPINSYIALDLSGIGVLNDSLGGVTVVSPETIGPFVAGQEYVLKGSMAQTFVRKRTLEVIEGNDLRMQRQKIYIEAFVDEVINQTKKDLQTPVNLYNAASPYVCTNMDASKITYLSLNAIQGNINQFEVKSLEGKLKAGDKYVEFYHDEDKLFELFLDVFYEPVS